MGVAKWSKFKKTRPNEEEIKHLTSYIEYFWNAIVNNFKELEEYLEKDSTSVNMAKPYRHEKGGHVLFRPAGLRTYASTIATCVKYDWRLDPDFDSCSYTRLPGTLFLQGIADNSEYTGVYLCGSGQHYAGVIS